MSASACAGPPSLPARVLAGGVEPAMVAGMEAPSDAPRLRIFIDADACPVKDEVYRVAARYKLRVFVVANSPILTPRATEIERVVVAAGPDVADDWIVERADRGAIVITSDVPLASRCVAKGAAVLAPTGKPFSENSIGMSLATRNLMEQLRSAGQTTRGPPPFSARDRSQFLSALDNVVTRLIRAGVGIDPL